MARRLPLLMENNMKTHNNLLKRLKSNAFIALSFFFTSMQALAESDEELRRQVEQGKGNKGGILGSIPVDQAGKGALESSGNWISVVQGYMGQGAALLGLGVSIVGFIWISYAAIAKFNECRTNRAEWSELGLLVIAGAALLVFISLLLTMSKGVLGTGFGN